MNYSYLVYKSLSEPEPRRLAELEEGRGQLLRVHEAEGQCIAVFAWGGCYFPAELREELRALVGKTVAVLRIDNRYHIRSLGAGTDAAR